MASDGYTFSIPAPDRRLDGQDFLSGPEHWVRTAAPVGAALPGTEGITQMLERRKAADGKIEEHWESCDGSCGPGCGGGDELMGGCEAVNGPDNPIRHTWHGADGRKVSCAYERWQCKTHPKCVDHDACLLKCKIGSDDASGCATLCHIKATGFCGTLGGWINGNPSDGCWDRKLTYSRVILGSCQDVAATR